MDDDKKRIAFGVGIILIGLLGLYGLYYFFFRTPPAKPVAEVPTTAPTTTPSRPGLPVARTGEPGAAITPGGLGGTVTTPEEGVPTAPTGPLPSPIANGGLTIVTPLTEQRVSAPALASNGRDVAYYNRDDGKFYRITPDGKPVPLSTEVFRDVSTVAWAPDTSKAVLEFPDGSNVLYNFAEKRQVTLPKFWTEFSFAPQGDAIAFKSIDRSPEDRWLAIASPDGSNATPIEPLGTNADKVTVNWSPNQQMIATFTESRNATQQELVFLGKNQENFRLAVLEGRQFEGQWTPQGDRMLYSVASPTVSYRPTLWIVDAAPGTSGENRKELGVETWADKCTIAPDNTTAYCAVPKQLPDGAGLVREVANTLPDTFWRVDLQNGTKTLLADPTKDTTAANLVLSEDGQYLFFTNLTTGVLEKVQLK